MTTALFALDPLAALLWEYDARTACLLGLAGRRRWGTGTLLPAHVLDALGPATVAELEQRANAMDADESVALALDALDRYVAAIDP